ncbi:hypothetical protein N9Z41_00120 [bacterium]|nr:hypothetical protein [bacterium]
MPNLPISGLPASDALTGAELFADVQGGVTKYTTLDDVANYVTSSFEYITPSQTGSFQKSAYLSIYDTGSQPLLVSGSEQVVTFSSTWASDGVSLQEGSKIVMEKAGVYQFSFVAQVTNLENAVYDSWFWIKYNGSNFPNSTTLMSLNPRKNSSIPSSQLMISNIVGVAQNDGDYIQLYWTGEDLATSLTETPATSVVPETPSIIANIHRVG